MPIRTRGVVALGALCLVTACGGPVEIDSPDLDAADRAACEAFVEDLPATLADEDEREIEPADALGSAYGDPAIVVTCGVELPEKYDEFSSCEVSNGVGWFVPQEQVGDPEADITLTAVGYRPVVEVEVPHDYTPDDPTEGNNTSAAAIAELAGVVEGHLELVQRCS